MSTWFGHQLSDQSSIIGIEIERFGFRDGVYLFLPVLTDFSDRGFEAMPMLDLTKLTQQMQGLSQYLFKEGAATQQKLGQAQHLLQQVTQAQATYVAQQQMWSDRLCFTAAQPVEPLHWRVALPAAPPCHTVIATDGSQIAPSHHEIAYCYLINIGRIILPYGQNRLPRLDSVPEVFYRPEDLYISRQWGIRTEEWMGYRRTLSEAMALAELGAEIVAREAALHGQKAAGTALTDDPPLVPLSPPAPALAMVDGSLIYWFLEALPREAQNLILIPILQAWERLRQYRIPLVGYVSASRSGETLNFLRLAACRFDQPDCPTYCPSSKPGPDSPLMATVPCRILEPLKDTTLWATELKPGQRSPLWRSAARILGDYGDHGVYFCYLHVGTEIARLEFPAWVATDATLLNQALSLTLAQVQKGYGYPISLAEAHNQAVVRGGDRTRFFALLEQQMIRAGLHNVAISYKEARKRGSIA